MTLYKMPLKSERSNQVRVSLPLKPLKSHKILEFSNFFRSVIKSHCHFHINSISRSATAIISSLFLNTKMPKTISERAMITSQQSYARYDVVSGKYTHFQYKESLHNYSKSLPIQQIIPLIP